MKAIYKKRIKKWIDALRSGEYKKGRLQLKVLGKNSGKKYNQFCCLGVACDLFAKSTRNGKWDGETFVSQASSEKSGLTTDVQRWLGIKGCDPTLKDDISAASLNDGVDSDNVKPHSFKKIAKLIEKKYLSAQ